MLPVAFCRSTVAIRLACVWPEAMHRMHGETDVNNRFNRTQHSSSGQTARTATSFHITECQGSLDEGLRGETLIHDA